jgi:hypothetical protein
MLLGRKQAGQGETFVQCLRGIATPHDPVRYRQEQREAATVSTEIRRVRAATHIERYFRLMLRM